MEINFIKEPFFHIIVDDTFSDLNLIFGEINLLKDKFLSPEQSGGATFEDGEHKKKNKGLFLDGCENYRSLKIVSEINKILMRIRNSEKWKNHRTLHRFYQYTGWTGYLLSHYECGDYYKPHYDDGLFTLITFLFDDHENRIGGDLYFPEYDYLHECKNNQSILFLSKEIHQVTTFKSKNNRYSISTFSTLWRRHIDPDLEN